MLVLARRVGERILIGPDIKVVVTEIGGGQVKLGIEAPPEVPIHREEVFLRMQGVPTPRATDTSDY